MNNGFVITGAPGSGKTPIIRELVAFGFGAVPEPAREVLAEQRAIDGAGVPERDPALFLALMLDRAVADYERMKAADGPVVFDRAIPDLIGYADLFGLDPSAAAGAADTHRYNELVFVTPSWPEIYVTDDERKMSFEAADAFGRNIRDIYARLGYTLVDVPRDGPAARARFIATTVGYDT